MSNLNYEFFDEFKQLDALCRDIYGTFDKKLGVTLYIEDMEKQSEFSVRSVNNWESDKRRLREVRNKRNELAHSRESFSVILCTQSDVDFVRSFKERILKQTDPLAILQKQKSAKQSSAPKKKADAQKQPHKKTQAHATKDKRDAAITAWSAIGIIAFLILAAWLIVQFTA